MPHHRLNSHALRNRFGLEINAPVFGFAGGIILLFVLLSVIFLPSVEAASDAIMGFVARKGGWFLVLAMNLILVFTVFIAASRFGRIRLGGPDAEPDFSRWSWFAMLFSAGMGIGLLFYSVAEPVMHYSNPPAGEGMTAEAAREAMRITFYHWGFHPWGMYALVGLSLAFFSYNRGLPLTVRYAFYPILGERVHGPIGHLVDVAAVVATLFGVSTSLGIGAQQVNAGLAHLFGFTQAGWVQVILIGGITALATISVVTGLDKGIRILSELNLKLAGLLLLFILILGPTVFLLSAFVQNVGSYIQQLPRLSSYTEAYRGTNWQDGWTTFYWAWWIGWSPFVGMFIAQISRGRTIREFILGVLLVPTSVTFLWMTVFGNTALFEELFGAGGLVEAVNADVTIALFVLLEKFPLSFFTSLIAIFVVVTFFVTSSDSGSLVIDIITAGGHSDPPVAQRIFWAVLEGLVAAVLLLGGGLGALQTAAVSTGLPFAVILLFMCYGLYKGLHSRYYEDAAEGDERDEEPTEKPGVVPSLACPAHGRGWVLLEWDEPVDGGAIAAYRIKRRRKGEEQWHEVAMSLEPTAALNHREREGIFQYVVTAVNRKGEGPAPDPVTVRL